MIKEVEGSLLDKKNRCTWPCFVKEVKKNSGIKDAPKDLLNVLEKLYQDKMTDHPPRRTRRE